MKTRLFIILIHDLVAYPPMQSLLHALSKKNLDIYFVGVCSDEKTKITFENLGISFIQISGLLTGNQLNILRQQLEYRNAIKNMMRNYNITKRDLLWFEYSYAVHMLAGELNKYRYVAHFYEFVNDNLSWKYKMLYPKFNMKNYLQNAVAVIHCEYNRAIISKGLYELKDMPYVLPNKPYFDETILDNVPKDIEKSISDYSIKTKNKKVVLYQGVFESNERRLEEFCQAIKELPEDFVFVAMGSGGEYYQKLRRKYESERVIFIPFIKPPYHLLVTQTATIGVMTYFPLNTTIAGVINPLYCAPNKIFEYSKYSIPMIANDIPGLKYIFECYHCGKTVSYPISSQKIADTIMELIKSEDLYKKGSNDYYNSVNFKEIVDSILDNVL